MSDIGVLKAWVPFEVPLSADMNANFTEIKTKFNSFALQAGKAITGDLIFTDALYDIGKTGTTRPRDIFASRNIAAGGVLITGALPATVGQIRIPNGSDIYARNSSDTTDIHVIGLAGNDVVRIGLNPSIIALGAPASTVSAVAGEVVLANAKALRAANAAGTSTIRLIELNTLDQIVIASGGQAILTGGALVIATSVLINGGAINMTNFIGNARILGGTTGLSVRDKTDSADNVLISDAGIVSFRGVVTLNGAAAGELTLSNGLSLRGVNAAGTNTFGLIALNASDQVLLSPGGKDIKWGSAAVALGGGAAPTFGTIGGSGPTVAAQSEWLKVYDAAGNPKFIPVWG